MRPGGSLIFSKNRIRRFFNIAENRPPTLVDIRQRREELSELLTFTKRS
jgi:hypothetical protein